jgi:RsiW-degrading membrane proteinase PrsW (M82 family)
MHISLMLTVLNRLFIALLALAALGGISVGLLVIFFPDGGFELESVQSMDSSPDFVLLAEDYDAVPDDSPYLLEYGVLTPPLAEFDQLYLEVYSEGRYLGEISCLDEFEFVEDYVGQTELNCTGAVPYYYSGSQEYLIYATLYGDGYEYVSGPAVVRADWTSYEGFFWEFSIWMVLLIGASYVFVLFPIILGIAYIASRMKHDQDYTIFSLLNPFANKRTLLQKFHSFMVSPYFWAFELLGISLILVYMLITAQVWKSGTAIVAFILSGLMAFVVPFLWCVAWWYADFREREPLRVLVTFFLWGMLAALMAIGINTVAGILFGFIGFAFLSTFLVAPIVEEFYKGSGVAILGEHREFDSIEDGLVYGFVIGMGFSFVEDWIYLIQTPMGSDVASWFLLFIMRAILFSANHGFYTAITGGAIGFLIERGFRAPAVGLLLGFPIAAVFHALHNSGEMLVTLFGEGGALAYCCLIIPLFDFGGLIVLLAVFLWALFRSRK